MRLKKYWGFEMKINKITLQNIRSYKQQEVVFPEGSTLLSGDIGSGKTSVLLAIEFALFGLQPGQRGSSLLKNGEKEGKVSIEFEVDGKKVAIERTLKRGKSVSQDYCSITVNNEKKELSVTELKSRVLEILNYPKEFSKKQNILYKFTVYTPQEEMKQIILQDSETRINTLRHVFGIDKYKRILENASIIISKIREEKRVKEGITMNLEQEKLNLASKEKDIGEKQSLLASAEKDLFLKKESRKRVQEDKEKIYKKVEEKMRLKQEIEKTKISILNKEDSISSNKKLMEQLKVQIKELQEMKFDESVISQIESEILSKKKEKEKLDDMKLEISSRINSLNIKNEDIRRLEQKISNLESCPTCLQNIDAVYRANVLNKAHSDFARNREEIESLEEEKKGIAERAGKIAAEIASKEDRVNSLKIMRVKLQGIEEKQARLAEMEKLNISLEKDISLLKQHNETLEKSVSELSVFDDIFMERQKELEEALKEERIADIKAAELKREVELFSRQIDELRERIRRTEIIKKELDYLSELENWLSKKFMPVISFVEKNVMAKLKSEFSRLFAEWFSMLVSDSFNVRLSEDFTPIIEQQDYELDYGYLSGGERTAIALAYRLSLNQVINSLLSKIKTKDIVILDEPTDGFSDQQLDKMRDVLQQLNVNQLIIVSHEQKIEGFVENVLKFKKEGGISMLEK